MWFPYILSVWYGRVDIVKKSNVNDIRIYPLAIEKNKPWKLKLLEVDNIVADIS